MCLAVKKEHPFEGGCIYVSKEAYDALIASGAVGNCKDGWEAHEDRNIFFIVNGRLGSTDLIDGSKVKCKRFHLVDGEFVWVEPEIELDATTGLDDLPLSSFAEMKEKLASGKYDLYFDQTNGWKFLPDPLLILPASKYRAILKEHSHIADAVIENPDIKISYGFDVVSDMHVINGSFFESYSENGIYIIESEKTIETNDGGKNDFYTFAPYVKNVDSLSRFLGLSFAEGNILKSLTSNLGDRHDGTDAKREAKKCLHYAVERMLYTFSSEEILSQIQKQLKGN